MTVVVTRSAISNLYRRIAISCAFEFGPAVKAAAFESYNNRKTMAWQTKVGQIVSPSYKSLIFVTERIKEFKLKETEQNEMRHTANINNNRLLPQLLRVRRRRRYVKQHNTAAVNGGGAITRPAHTPQHHFHFADYPCRSYAPRRRTTRRRRRLQPTTVPSPWTVVIFLR